MNNSIKTDDVIFNFFKQICDEKDDQKCIELGNNWIAAMEMNLTTPLSLLTTMRTKLKRNLRKCVNQPIITWKFTVNGEGIWLV